MKSSIIILNFATSEVDVYNDVEMSDEDNGVSFITDKTSHNIDDCEWLISHNPIHPQFKDLEE